MKVDALLTLYGKQERQQPGPQPAPGVAGEEGHNLLAGQLVKARVAAVAADGRYELEIGGHTILARSGLPLEIGRQLWLEVQVAGKSLLLSRPQGQEAVQELLQHLASDGQGSAKTIASLLQLPANGGKQLDPETAARLLPLLRGLAALTVGAAPVLPGLLELLLLMRPPGGRGGAAVPSLSELVADFLHTAQQAAGQGNLMRGAEVLGVERLLALLEACNLLNGRPAGPGQPPFCLLPCFFGGDNGRGVWMCSVDEEAKQEERGSRPGRQILRFFLQMSKLGPLSLVVKLHDRQLMGTIACGEEQVVRFLAARLPEVEAVLAAQGYGPVRFSCQQTEVGLLQEFKAQLEGYAGLPAMALLDVKV